MWTTARQLILVLQIVTVLQAQWILPVRAPAVSVTPHAPADRCATTHQCGCPAELTAHHACCCFESSEHAEHNDSPKKPVSPFEKLLRAAQCGGDRPAHNAVVASLEFVPGATVQVGPVNVVEILLHPSSETPVSRSSEPPDPPPRSVFLA